MKVANLTLGIRFLLRQIAQAEIEEAERRDYER
jgi:hypothetical protein